MFTETEIDEFTDDDCCTFAVLPEPTTEPPDPFAGAERCGACEGEGITRRNYRSGLVEICAACRGVGYHGLDAGPTTAEPWSLAKIAVMAARYDLGMPVFNAADARFGSLK